MRSPGLFLQTIEITMIRHEHVRTVGNAQMVRGDTLLCQSVQFPDEHLGIDDYAVADDTGDVRIKNSRRDQVQPDGTVIDDHRVAGVVPA